MLCGVVVVRSERGWECQSEAEEVKVRLGRTTCCVCVSYLAIAGTQGDTKTFTDATIDNAIYSKPTENGSRSSLKISWRKIDGEWNFSASFYLHSTTVASLKCLKQKNLQLYGVRVLWRETLRFVCWRGPLMREELEPDTWLKLVAKI